jgi:hypothetical protein
LIPLQATRFVFSLVFGGFLGLPIFAGWFYVIWRSRFSGRFFWFWVPLFVLSTALVILFVHHLNSVWLAFGEPVSEVSGPISPVPNLSFPSLIAVTMLIFSSVISPLILVLTLGMLPLRKRALSQATTTD